MLIIPHFVLGKFLVLIFNIKPSVLSLTSDPRSKLTNFVNISDNGNDFNTPGEFGINLVGIHKYSKR